MGERTEARKIQTVSTTQDGAKPTRGSSSASETSKLAQYSDLFQRMLDTVFLLDYETFDVLDVNPAGEDLLERPMDQIVGHPLLPYIEESEQSEFKKALRISKRRYYPRGITSNWKTPNGEKILVQLVVCTLQLTNQKEVIQVIAKDITKQHEAELKIQKYLEELKSLNQKLEALSTTDEMTKLNNFRSFKSKLAEEHARVKRYQGTYSIVFCDVDNFKHYNDQNGHPAGDALLKTLGEILVGSCRTGLDFPARYGGEEFVVICPETGLKEAHILANRLRKAVEATNFPNGEKQPLGKVTISIGIAAFPDNGGTEQDVLKSADEALYHSKHAGRNRITSASDIKAAAPKQ